MMRHRVGLGWLLIASACGAPAAPANPATKAGPATTGSTAPTADRPDPPMPVLATGSATPHTDAPSVTGTVVAASLDRGMETLEVRATWPLPPGSPDTVHPQLAGATSRLAGSPAYAFVRVEQTPGTARIWVRRPAAAGAAPLAIELYTTASDGEPGTLLRVTAAAPPAPHAEPAVVAAWETDLAAHLSDDSEARHNIWDAFATARLTALVAAAQPHRKGAPAAPVGAHPYAPTHVDAGDGLESLMATTSGTLATQEALQTDRPLFVAAAHEPANVSIDKTAPPAVIPHPWAHLMKRVARVAPPAEPLAQAVPADNYYVRAGSFDAFTTLLDQVDAWGTPVGQFLDNDPIDLGLAPRYEAELGVRRSPLARALGSHVISALALTGSDPYLREGSDVTLIFKVSDHALFGTALAGAIAEHAQVHGALTTEKVTLAGVPVTVTRSADGTVRQHRATVGDLELVSNSPAGLTRVLDTIAGKHPRLADEPDFKYMLARDATAPADVLAYVGDRFVGAVIGPAQKIGEARRAFALGELLTPGFAALLYGRMFGTSPAATADLFATHLLDPRELTHAHGGAITWTPGHAARSSWGTPAELMPLIDLPAVTMITASEQAGYDRFSRNYERSWRSYVDPIAARLTTRNTGGKLALTLDLRQLPLIDESAYRDIEHEAAGARIEVAPLASGARVVVALGEGSTLRRILGQSREVFGGHKVEFDWIGEFATIGVADRSQIALGMLEALRDDRDRLEPPPASNDRESKHDSWKLLNELPVYAEIAVKNPLGASAALAGMRAMALESSPGLVTWGQLETYRDVPIVRIAVDAQRAKRDFDTELDVSVYYAITRGALIVSLNHKTIHDVIDARLDNRGPVGVGNDAKAHPDRGTQLAIDLATEAGHALWYGLVWSATDALDRHNGGTSAGIASALMYGAPDHAADAAAMRALAFAYFGIAPLTTSGGAFTLAPEGVIDPVRGSDYARRWPALPVAGSPVEALARVVARSRAELSFDDEGTDPAGKPLRSLHAHLAATITP